MKKEKDQGQSFIEAAKSLGCDESQEHCDEALKKIAAHKPADEPPGPPVKEPKTKKPAK